MNEIEKMISEFILQDPAHPVSVEINGELTDEMVARIKKAFGKPKEDRENAE